MHRRCHADAAANEKVPPADCAATAARKYLHGMFLVRLNPKDARAVAQGHPWVYREAIAEKPRNLKQGEVVDIGDAARDFVARGIYDAAAPVAVRVWTRDRDERIDAELIARRIRDAASVRERAGFPERSDAYRLVNAEGDFLPGIVIDRWGEWTSVTLQSDALRKWEPAILEALDAAAPSRGVYVRDDERSRLAAGEAAPDDLVVREPTGRYLVRLAAPGKPGVFTDMREVRVALAAQLRGRSFLNLFAHTGAFSACAAAAGASRVVSVDLSRPFLEVASRNVEANAPGAAHETVAADVFEALRKFAGEKRRFDAVLADPPTFSSSKSSGAFSVREDYRSLARACLRVLVPGGLLVAATNFRGMETDEFLRMLHDASEAEARPLRVLAVHGQPGDHPSLPRVPETRHLRVVFCA